jgi:hypothetical protein
MYFYEKMLNRKFVQNPKEWREKEGKVAKNTFVRCAAILCNKQKTKLEFLNN